MQKSWFQVIKDAIQMYVDRDKYAYFYGAKGIVLTDQVMNALWNAEPAYFRRYTAEQKRQIFNNSRGKIGYDCSGFVCKVTGETGYSTEIYSKRTVETSLAEGVAGQFLYTTWGGAGRHIALDAGMGFVLDMGYESTDENVRLHRDSVHLYKITDVAYEHSFQTAAVNYRGSYGTDPNGGVAEFKVIIGAQTQIGVGVDVHVDDALHGKLRHFLAPFRVAFIRQIGKSNRCRMTEGVNG